MAEAAVTVPTQTLLEAVAEVAAELGVWAVAQPVQQAEPKAYLISVLRAVSKT